MTIPNEPDCYAAVAARDARMDGRFVYAVLSTGIYCRPSCPARAARPDNLRFHATPESARDAGFRACKRCHPDSAKSEAQCLAELAQYIAANAELTLPLSTLAKRVSMSPAHLQRRFVATFGVSPKVLQDAARLQSWREELRDGKPVTQATQTAGYGSTSRVYGRLANSLGMTPKAYRAGGQGETISYAVRNTVLGPLLMAATDRGICSAQFGTSSDELTTQLQSEFPNAQIDPKTRLDDSELDIWIDALDAHLSRSAPHPDLPLDLRGTAFQIKVWRYLLGIERGQVLSYGELASAIGNPKATRAAASACGANRVAVLIPCHRVLRADGGLGGYRWGLERKRALLDAERTVS